MRKLRIVPKKEVQQTPCKIEFRDVSFRYPDSKDFVLKHLNVTINPQEKIAVVGKNGSGKTTFIKLLCRLYEPTEGSIFVNGKDISEYEYGEYLRMLSVVFQDFALFSMPLKENVSGEPASRYRQGEAVPGKGRKHRFFSSADGRLAL